MSNNIPNLNKAITSKKATSADDFSKYVVIDTDGLVLDAEQAVHVFDIAKTDPNAQDKLDVITAVWNAQGFEVKLRERQTPVVDQDKKAKFLKKLGNVA